MYMEKWNEKSVDFMQELTMNIATAKQEILKEFLVKNKLNTKWKKIFLEWTEIEISMRLKFAKNTKDNSLFESYEIYLPEVKEPIHTLWIKITFEDKKVQVIPMFDKEVKEYLELDEVTIINQSK